MGSVHGHHGRVEIREHMCPKLGFAYGQQASAAGHARTRVVEAQKLTTENRAGPRGKAFSFLFSLIGVTPTRSLTKKVLTYLFV